MATTIKLSDALIEAAKPYATAMQRSLPKQIEYWARIGKTAEHLSAHSPSWASSTQALRQEGVK